MIRRLLSYLARELLSSVIGFFMLVVVVAVVAKGLSR